MTGFPSLQELVQREIARRQEQGHRPPFAFVSDPDCASTDVEGAVAAIVDDAANRASGGCKRIDVNSAVADAVSAALEALDPRRLIIVHEIWGPSREVANRPGPHLAGRGDAHWAAGTSAEDEQAELAVARAQERIAAMRDGN